MAKDTTENAKTKKKTASTQKKVETKKAEKKETKVAKTTKTVTKSTKKAPTTKKKAVVKKDSKVASVSKKTANKKTTLPKKQEEIKIIEYYDLPYTYNQTTVKILAQTPTTLFVYWDISEKDKEKYKQDFGEKFFEFSKPILIIHNITKQTTYEVEINDFANSWYLKMTEPNCNYEIELARKIFDYKSLIESNQNNNKQIDGIYSNKYISITNSNNLETPNDHILLENIYPGFKFLFRNVKTGEQITKELETLTLMPNIYKLFDFYKTIYKDEIMEDDYKTTLSNPSSSSIFK